MKGILSYGCRFNKLETEITIKPLDDDLAGFETTLKKEFIRKIFFDYYSNIYVIKGYYPNNGVDECFKGVELERWASLKNSHKDAVKKVRIRWVRGEHVDREISFNACAIKYKEEIDTMNHHFYLLLIDVDREREIGYNNTITVNNCNLLYITIKPYIENESLNSVLRKLDNKYTSISDLKSNYALINDLPTTGIASTRSIVEEDYWEMKLLVFSLSTEFKSVSFELNINFNKNGYDGLVNNGRPLNILRRIISVLTRHISSEAIKDVENIKKNFDIEKVLLSRQLKEKVKEIIKREDLIIQPRLNSIRVCKNNNGGGIGMSMNQGSNSRMNWHQKVSLKPPRKDFTLDNYQLSLPDYDYSSWRTFKYNSNKIMKGEDVKQLQTTLKQLGANLEVDGYYGTSTKKAVMEFQKSRGLKVDGVVGLNTRMAIMRNLGVEDETNNITIEINRTTETTLSTIGELSVNGKKIGYTLENPWKDNKRYVSRIPVGEYNAHIRKSDTSKWDYDVIELEDVPGRKNIQIHRGNKPNDTEGCILTGKTTTTDWVGNSTTAHNEIMEKVDDDSEIVVIIKENF